MNDNFDLKKYLIENKATANSKMLNENTMRKSPMDDPRVEEIIQMLNDMDVDGETMEYILRQVGMDDQMASQLGGSEIGETKKKHSKMMNETASETVYEYTFILSRGMSYDGVEEITAQKMVSDIKEYYAEQGPEGFDMMQIYATTNTETGAPAVAVELEDRIILYSMVQLSEEVATKTAKKATSGKTIEPSEAEQHLNKMNETKKKHSKMMKEASNSDREAIENWYHRTNFYIDDLSPEEIEKGIQDHYKEWTAVKDQYSSIEDYFADVERNSDWY